MVTLLPQTSSMRYYTFMIVICSGVVVHMLSVFCNSMINGILSVTLSFLGSNKNFEIQYHEITNTISTHDYSISQPSSLSHFLVGEKWSS